MATSYFDSSFGNEIASLVHSGPLDDAIAACLDAIVIPLRMVCGTTELLAYALQEQRDCYSIAQQMIDYTQQLWHDSVWKDLFAFRSLLATSFPAHTTGGYPSSFAEPTTEPSRALHTWQQPLESILPSIIQQMRLLGQHIQQSTRQLTVLCSAQIDSETAMLLQQIQVRMDDCMATVENVLDGVLVDRIRQVCRA
jgi:hypothetical protein